MACQLEVAHGHEPLPVSHMWNLSAFYLDLTVVYATHDCLESFDHFLCRSIDGMCRRDQRVMDRQCCKTIVVRRSERAQYQFAVDPHQAHAGIGAKGFADRLVSLFDGSQQLGGIGTASRRAGVARRAVVSVDIRPTRIANDRNLGNRSAC